MSFFFCVSRAPSRCRVDAAPSSLVHRPWHLSHWRNLVGAVSCITALMRRWRIDQIASNARDRVDHPGENSRSRKGTSTNSILSGKKKEREKNIFSAARDPASNSTRDVNVIIQRIRPSR